MFDLKVIKANLKQLCDKKGIEEDVIIQAMEEAMAAAYKKDYGEKNQIIRAKLDMDTGDINFYQVKIVVSEDEICGGEDGDGSDCDDEGKTRFDAEKHILLEDARRIKGDVSPGDEIVFNLEGEKDFGRIAAQTARQVIMQKIRQAEKKNIVAGYADKINTVVGGVVQKIQRGNVFIDLDKAVGVMNRDDSIASERYTPGQRIRAYLYDVSESDYGITLKLSRSKPEFVVKLFEIESPEVASGTVEIKSVAREAGSRTKMAVYSRDDSVDPVGACVGQSGVRVQTVRNELSGEKIDIMPWSEDPAEFIANALSPATINSVEIDEEENLATVTVDEDQLSLAIGISGQNVRLAVKLTGYKIDIRGSENEEGEGDEVDMVEGDTIDTSEGEYVEDGSDDTVESGRE